MKLSFFMQTDIKSFLQGDFVQGNTIIIINGLDQAFSKYSK